MRRNIKAEADWPALPFETWRETCATLQLWSQIVGKVRLAQTPWVNHSWHVTLYVTARGLGTSLIPVEPLGFEMEFDFVAHQLVIRTTRGEAGEVALRPRSMADFHADVLATLARVGAPVSIDPNPNEVPDPIPFTEDHAVRVYDAEAANRFWRVLV